ncbi:MAG: hypothetical protein HRT53_17455 [Colwellia sp.]|nr:hypothetical protein [Colwellia sp.]
MSIINTLTKGWLFRIFTALLLLTAIVFSFFWDTSEKQSTYGVAILILFINFYLLGLVGYRVALLTQHTMAKVIPDYYLQLKGAVKKILLFSLLTTLTLLPNVTMMLGTMTWLLVIFLFLAISYLQPSVWLVFSASIFAVTFSSFDFTLAETNYWLWQVPAYCLPVFGFISYQVINRLDRFKMRPELKVRYSTYSGLSMSSSFNSIDKMPEKARPKLQQWIIDNNLVMFRKLLRSDKKISKLTLVDIASSGVNRFGKASFFGWSTTVALFCLYQHFFPLSTNTADDFYMMFFAMFSVGINAMGSTISFFTLNERKEYLARLRLMPLFNNEQEFSRLVLKVFFINQGKLLLFTLVSSTLVISMVWSDPTKLLVNTLVINTVSFCFFSALVLFGLHTKKQVKTIIMVIMMILFILLIPVAVISYKENIHLLISNTTQGVMVIGFVLLMLALAKWKFKVPSWQKLS